jgi:hypothetical protein
MEPDRFDDVESTILEAPAPRERNPLRRRVALVMAAGLVLAGGMSAAADALTTSGQKAAQAAPKVQHRGWTEYAPMSGYHPCHRGQHHRAPASDPRY